MRHWNPPLRIYTDIDMDTISILKADTNINNYMYPYFLKTFGFLFVRMHIRIQLIICIFILFLVFRICPCIILMLVYFD